MARRAPGHQAQRRMPNSWEDNRWPGGANVQEDNRRARRVQGDQKGTKQLGLRRPVRSVHRQVDRARCSVYGAVVDTGALMHEK